MLTRKKEMCYGIQKNAVGCKKIILLGEHVTLHNELSIIVY